MPDPAPAPAPEPSPAPTPTPAPTPAPAPATFDWATSGIDAESAAFVTTKGYKGPGDVIGAYRNLEKLVGVPADQIIKLPAATEGPEAMNAVYDRLGRPKSADDYVIPMPKEGGDPAFAKTAAAWFHEQGLSQKQAEGLTAKWNEYIGGAKTTNAAATEAAAKVDDAKLRADWPGASYDANVGLAQRAVQAFGLDANAVQKLENALGYAGVMRFMHQIGSRLGSDDRFVAGDTGGGGSFGTGLTREMATARKAELMTDPGFARRFGSSDPAVAGAARDEMARLNRLITGNSVVAS